MAALSFAVVVICSLAADWVASPDGQLGLAYGVATASQWATQHDYRFVVATHPSPGPEAASKRLEWRRNGEIQNLFADPKTGALRCQVDWAFWLEADVFITNLTVSLDDLVAEATRLRGDGAPAELVLNRDAAGNINTGTGLIRCSEAGLRMLRRLDEIRYSHANDRKLVAWGANGATMILHREYRASEYAKDMTFVPAKLLNAYPLAGMLACEGAACADLYWSPGDFVVHFAGHYPKESSYRRFLELHPTATWPGYEADTP